MGLIMYIRCKYVQIFDYTITLDAISKSLTGTGLRLGWMALPPALAPPVVALIGHMGPATRPIQAAAKLYEIGHIGILF